MEFMLLSDDAWKNDDVVDVARIQFWGICWLVGGGNIPALDDVVDVTNTVSQSAFSLSLLS
jgi:hypothetical protein